MVVMLSSYDIPDDSWDEIIRLSGGYPAKYIAETYDAEYFEGTSETSYYKEFKFTQEKYVEFALRWL